MGQLLHHKKAKQKVQKKNRQSERRTFHTLERIVRGFSNHRRIEILGLLTANPNLSVASISEELDINFKTASVHIQRLALSGLVEKHGDGNMVRHSVTPRGIDVLKFLRTLE